MERASFLWWSSCIGLAKNSFHKMLWKNLKELLGAI